MYLESAPPKKMAESIDCERPQSTNQTSHIKCAFGDKKYSFRFRLSKYTPHDQQ